MCVCMRHIVVCMCLRATAGIGVMSVFACVLRWSDRCLTPRSTPFSAKRDTHSLTHLPSREWPSATSTQEGLGASQQGCSCLEDPL